MQLLIFTSTISTRKDYLFEFLFEFLLGISFKITDNKNDFLNYDGPKISYSGRPLGDEIHFEETPFLSQKGITPLELSFVAYDNYEIPFPVNSSLFPFDVFAASFLLVARYEEYLNPVTDAHGRFEAKSSLAYKKGFLDKPVIDEWGLKILTALKKRFPAIQYRKRAFIFQPTLDIDTAYYLKTERPLKRILRTVKQFLNGNLKVLVKDPFDVYDEVHKWDKEFSTTTMFFMLMNNKHVYDSRENKRHKLFKNLIKRLERDFVIGLHPSYSSNENKRNLAFEKNKLGAIASNDVHLSRQHYLKLTFPETYNNLIKVGIREDYTMLYADLPGFRASTCNAFLWYNLSEETKTNFLVQPSVVMDQTLRKYMGLSKKEAIKQIERIMQNVKEVDGVFVSLWHNESVSDFGVWKDWKSVYIEMLKMSKFYS